MPSDILPNRERQIIHMYYIEEEMGYDPDIMDEVRLGRTTYYKVKGKALLRLAFSLRKEGYKQKTQTEEVEVDEHCTADKRQRND